MTPPSPLVLGEVAIRERASALASWRETEGQRLLLKDVTLTQDDVEHLADVLDRVSFKQATFEGPVSFANVAFPDMSLSFIDTTFRGRVSFADAVFQPKTYLNFSMCEFRAPVSFAGVDFGVRSLKFAFTNFHDDCDFGGAVMANNTRFEHVVFHARAILAGIQFGSALTQFIDCEFRGPINLTKTALPNEARVQFTRCSLPQSAEVGPAQGSGSVMVEESVPSGILDSLVTPGGPRAFDPPVDGYEFRFLEGNHHIWIDVISLVWLLPALAPVQLVLRREADPYAYDLLLVVDDNKFEIQELAGTDTRLVESGSEREILSKVLAHRTLRFEDLAT